MASSEATTTTAANETTNNGVQIKEGKLTFEYFAPFSCVTQIMMNVNRTFTF